MLQSCQHLLRMWHLLGKFSACSFCGGVFGAFGWGCFAQALASRYLGRDESLTQQQRYQHLAESYSWLVPWLVGYGVEVLCMSVCMLMVVDRLVSHVGRTYKLSINTIRRISLSFFAFVLVLCSAGLVANIAVGVYNAQTAVKFNQAADACLPTGNSTAQSGLGDSSSVHCISFYAHTSDLLFAQAYEIYSTASFTLLFQNWFEAITLIAIVAVFIVMTPMSAIILRRAYAPPLRTVHFCNILSGTLLSKTKLIL